MGSRSLIFCRNYSTAKSVSFFTTPIYYVNAKPHIGHLYSSLIADASQRWQKLKIPNLKITFSTGTDEHGTKIQRAAKMHKTTINGYCEAVSKEYRDLADNFSVEYSDFIRTSEARHKNTVQAFWQKLVTKGVIYKSTYRGYYCVSDETFLSDSQLKEIVRDGEKLLVSAESGHHVEWSEEPNYIFKLRSFRDELVYWLKQNEKAVIPQKFHKILLDLVNSDGALADISVSRPASRVHWGTPVPDDPDQTVYVWLDALINYLTVAGYSQEKFKNVWPPDLQVIGKDILKFHGVYWPAFLMAADLEPPRYILCHSHWTVDGEKMSKSKGNVVNPAEKSDIFTGDGLRYFLLREGVNHSDGNYSDTKVLRLLNSELADTLGNLLSRCCGKALNPNQEFPRMNAEVFQRISQFDVTKQLITRLENLPVICATHYDDYNFYKSADVIIGTLHAANLFFETLKPWELKKRPDDLEAVLHLAMETLRVCGILLLPLTPDISEKLLNKLSIPRSERSFDDLSRFSWRNGGFRGRKLGGNTAVLFKRIVMAEERIKGAQNG